jgi:ABC transporter substrate binding protein (PQQ-dependent alcohol dehydrogenase system)
MRLALALLAVLLVAPSRGDTQTLLIGYLGQQHQVPFPLGPLDQVATDEGLQGARLGIVDDNTTGKFLGQRFELLERRLTSTESPAAGARHLAAEGVRLIVADLDAGPLLDAIDGVGTRDMLFLNSRAPDDLLRAEDCRANLLHTIPSRAMLADGLAQYLVWKRWSRWFLLTGLRAGDQSLAAALRRSATRFGAEIVVDQPWSFRPANGRADTGHVTLQTEIPAATQVDDYDVLVVADEADEFGAYLEGRTLLPRPVAGTQGLTATGWSPLTQEWGATQLQDRFATKAGRRMTAVDYAAWAAVRGIGEAATRTQSLDPAKLAAYMRSDDFLLAGFKGQGLSYRAWDGQLRQPILIAGSRLLVSASPQPGFLHQRTPLDTLGVDQEESTCRF